MWGIVSGREKRPDSSKPEEVEKWESKAEQAAGDIFLLVEASQRVHFRGYETNPVEMRARLERHFMAKKPGARFNAYDELFSIQKAEDESLVDLGTRVENAMAQIKNLRPKDMTLEDLDKELEAMALIRALPDKYAHLSTSLMLLDKLDAEVVLGAFRSEDLHQKRAESANLAKTGTGGKGRGGGFRPRRDMSDVICYRCDGKGHIGRYCPQSKDKAGTGAVKKAEEKAGEVTEFAGQASAVSSEEALATSANDYDWNADTVGITSHGGYKYWITFITDKGRFKTVVPIKRKSDAFEAFKQYKAWAENQTGEKIGALQYDGGGEYISNEFKALLKTSGIELRVTTRNRPQQNGVAERANRTLGNAIVTMLAESGLSKRFWCEAMAAYVHVWNRVPTSAVPNTTPFEEWYKRKPSVGHLRVWGCVAYVHVQKDKQGHLGSHMVKCVFIGYPDGVKGWKFYNPETRKVIVSEHADFDERYTFGGVVLNGPDGNAQEEGDTYEPGSLFGSNRDDEDKEDAPPAVEENPQPQLAVEEDLQPVSGDGNGDLEQPEQPEEDINPQEPKVEEPHAENELDLGNDRQSATPIPPSDDETDDRPIAVRRPRRNAKPPGEWWKVKQPTSDSEDEGQEERDKHSRRGGADNMGRGNEESRCRAVEAGLFGGDECTWGKWHMDPHRITTWGKRQLDLNGFSG
ncbi:putative integrase core domain containing protein [Lyophyllum shimeji]|uniref:Integrase core domain containing protein n=1 Tax=Lyophyllum shimeji TaxID=47721 RepID=A0A9P3PTA7_LYOSH|nr:putative integrase core domain containing protein [Lyophyllum shimeji]